VSRGDFVQELLLTGELQAVRSVTIKSPETALFQLRITFMAKEGSVVKAGEPLVSFDSASLASQALDLDTRILDARTQVVAKENEMASALKDLEIELAEREHAHARARLEASVDPDVLSRKLHSERQLALQTAARELEETKKRIALTRARGTAERDVLVIERDKLLADLVSARQDLELLTILAPSDGLVVYEPREGTTLPYQEGDSCWPGQAIVRLPDLSQMQVLFNVNEVDAPLLATGMGVRLSLDAFPGRELTGEIVHVPSMAVKRDETSKLAIFKVTCSLSETWVGEMKPGMSVLGRVPLEAREGVPLVARADVETRGDEIELPLPGERGELVRVRPLARNARHYVLPEADAAPWLGPAGGDT
jgi:multidrug efflux pump subunit AcrA (membrane-fusion protein)